MNIHDNPQIEILKEEMVMGIRHNQLLFYIAIAILVLVIVLGVVITHIDENNMDNYIYPLLTLKVILGVCIIIAIGLFFLDEHPTGQTLYTIRAAPDFPWENYKDNYIVVDVNQNHTMWLIQDKPKEDADGEG